MRCFIALELSDEVKQKAAALSSEARKLDLQANFVNPEQQHITLVFLGELPDADAAKKLEAFKSLEGKLPPSFKLKFSGTGFFPNENFIKVFWVGCEAKGLQALQKTVAQALGTQEERDFNAHLTVCRIKGRTNLEALKALQRKHATTEFGSCYAEKICFKKSTLGPTGPVYEDLAALELKSL
ncbi:RNA 2',3'-cyclic phosphodiesterase [Candidatus Micrarchaeota archaeon]|nr:RNA 2',3'-cyclic phosphodiesterase [Candidatus Micrarchaeota archaeon]